MIDIPKFRRGDHRLFEELIRAHGPMVLNVVRAYGKDSCHAEDLFQEVWRHAFERRDAFTGKGSFPAWLHRLATNVCISEFRARKSRARTLDQMARQGMDSELGWRPLDPLGEAEREEFHGRLHLALGQLTDREHQAITLRVLEGRSPEEVASIMDITKTTVRSHIRRGMTRLREWMEDPENGLSGQQPTD